jgi:hypothetical protein
MGRRQAMSDAKQTPTPDPELRELFEALRMPPDSLRSWFEQIRGFCEQHGGRPRYSELLDLMDECLEQL